MTGTSLDGLDAVLAEINGTGLDMTARYHAMVSKELDAPADSTGSAKSFDLRSVLRTLASGQPAPPLVYLQAARQLGELHAQALVELAAQGPRLDLVVAHGQTIWHAPDVCTDAAAGRTSGGGGGYSWQLFDPWPIVYRLGVPVVYDLRQADIIAGGQGAPITPLSDWVMYRHPQRSRLIVNLGGICNVTRLPAGCRPGQVTGSDVGPCNLLIDGMVALAFSGMKFDDQGKLAAAGGVSSILYRLLTEASFFQRAQPRSTGREDFSPAFMEELYQRTGLKPHDQIASAVDAVARLIATEVERQPTDEVILAGGGTSNRVLVRAIRQHCPPAAQVILSDELGIPTQAREAMGFAVLGALAQDGLPITLPQVTGARHDGDHHGPGRAGAWVYP